MIAWLGGRSAAAVTFGAMTLAAIVYRAMLVRRLVTEEITPFSFVASRQALISLVQHLAVDMLFAGACAGLIALAGRWRAAGLALAGLLLVMWGLAAGAHYDMVFALHEGLGWHASTEGLGGNFGVLDIKSYATGGAVVLGTLPLVLAGALRWHPPGWAPARGRLVALAAAAMLLAAIPARFPGFFELKGWQPKAPLRRLPFVYWLMDTADQSWSSQSALHRRAEGLPPVQASGGTPTEPAFAGGPPALPPAEPAPPAGEGRWNVLVLILESVSDERAFQEGPDGAWPVPMPNLLRLAQEGLWLTDHRSTSNSSARSIWSILSGLYPRPQRQMYSTRPGLKTPSLATHLEPADAFLVTPSRLQSYFPRAWLANTGFTELVGFDELPPSAEGRPQWPSGRNELDAVDFFVERLERAAPPFLAVYYSYAPHYHYYDYGEGWRIAPDLDDPLHRYVNNLRLLDAQIERILAATPLDRTAVLIVGDHGEAFGEHEGNWTHSRHSYEENLHTPALLWQPRLFAPRRVATPTSHVDLMPALLAAVGRPLPDAPPQRYTFSYGNEDTLTSVRRADRRKVQWRRAEDRCVVFDLQADPREEAGDACPDADTQVDTLLRFDRFMKGLLR